MSNQISEALGYAAKEFDKGFKQLLALGAVGVLALGVGGYFYVRHLNKSTAQKAAYDQAYSMAVQLADRNNNQVLDADEFVDLYTRAGVAPVTYNPDSREQKTNKLTLSDLEKAIKSYTN